MVQLKLIGNNVNGKALDLLLYIYYNVLSCSTSRIVQFNKKKLSLISKKKRKERKETRLLYTFRCSFFV